MGGLFFSTMLTLVVVPVVYTYLAGRAAKSAEAEALAERTVAEA